MKALKNFLVGVVLVGGLAACTSTYNTVAYSCAGMTSALEVLTIAREEDKLSQSEISQVNDAIEVVDPYCGAEEAPTSENVSAKAFSQARNFLLSKMDEVR